jgi:hypothetical protein
MRRDRLPLAGAALALCALALFETRTAGAQDEVWIARRLPWYSLPDRALAGGAPVSLETPPIPGACGAASDRVEPFAARGAVILRVAIRVESGAVAISLRGADASVALSKQRTLTEQDGDAVVYLRLEPGSDARVIALCNAGQAGVGGRADVQSVRAARVDGLPADEAAKANLGLL